MLLLEFQGNNCCYVSCLIDFLGTDIVSVFHRTLTFWYAICKIFTFYKGVGSTIQPLDMANSWTVECHLIESQVLATWMLWMACDIHNFMKPCKFCSDKALFLDADSFFQSFVTMDTNMLNQIHKYYRYHKLHGYTAQTSLIQCIIIFRYSSKGIWP